MAKKNLDNSVAACDVPDGADLPPTGGVSDADYWTGTQNDDLPNAQPLGLLGTGLVTSTGGAPGVITNASGVNGYLLTLVGGAPEWAAAPAGLALSSATPQPLGSATGGVGTTASRFDHVHAHGGQAGGTLHAEVVSGGDAGFMSGADKAALDAAVAAISGLSSVYVPLTRTLTTTSPLLIDGGASASLSANRTLSIPAATSSTAGHATAAQITELTAATAAIAALALPKYIVQEATGTLSAEQSIGALTTGILKNTVTAGVGVLSAAAAADIPSLLTTKGDLLGFSTLPLRLPVGTNDYVLTADSTAAAGVAWKAAAASGYTTIQGNGTPVTARSTINFSTEFTVADVSSKTAVSLATNAIAHNRLAQIAGLSVLGNITPTLGDIQVITAANDHEVFRRIGSSVGFGTIGVGAIAGTQTNGFVATLVAGVPTWSAASSGANALAKYVVTDSSNAPANAVLLSSLATGMLSVTTSTGALASTAFATNTIPLGSGSKLVDSTLTLASNLLTHTASSASAVAALIENTGAGSADFTMTAGVAWKWSVQNADTTPYADPLTLKRGSQQIFKLTQDYAYIGGTDNTGSDQNGANCIATQPHGAPGAVFYGGTTASSGEVTALFLKGRYSASFSTAVALEFLAAVGVGLPTTGTGYAKIVSASASGTNGTLAVSTKKAGTYTESMKWDALTNTLIGGATAATTMEKWLAFPAGVLPTAAPGGFALGGDTAGAPCYVDSSNVLHYL